MAESSKGAQLERVAPVPIRRLAFGVRYEPQFGLMDNMGAVIDTILRQGGTPFGPDVFPLAQNTSTEHVLINPETGDFLRIGHQDTLLSLSANSRQYSLIRRSAINFRFSRRICGL
jgi:hypothetical protein